MTSPDFQESARRALETTRQLIVCFGPRLAGTQACLDAAHSLQQALGEVCTRAELETFSTHPAAFMRYHWINVPIFLFCLVLLYLGLPLPAAILELLIVIGGFAEFGYYKELYDPLFPKRTCANLVAVLEPQGKAEQQIILSGHHDSAQILNLLRGNQKIYGLKIIVPDIVGMTQFLFAWIWVFSLLSAGKAPVFTPYVLAFLTIASPLVISKAFIVSPRGSPGAGDNLIASAMLVELARLFGDHANPGKSRLNRTRLMFVSFDAEESGLRGSRAFAGRHQAELQPVPTTMLNIDSIYNAKDIQFMVSDLNGTVELSHDLAARCARLAGAAGFPQKLTRMVFGGGGTDAAELAPLGVQATTLIAMPTKLIRDGLVYHTEHDTVDAIEPEAVEGCLRIAYSLVCVLEGED